MIAFVEGGEIKVGDPAKRQAVTNPTKTIASVKRFMGNKFSESKKDAERSGLQSSTKEITILLELILMVGYILLKNCQQWFFKK